MCNRGLNNDVANGNSLAHNPYVATYPREKRAGSVWGWRLYGLAALVCALGSFVWFIVVLLIADDVQSPLWFGLSAALMVQLGFFRFNVMSFSWKYSILGRLARYVPSARDARCVGFRTNGVVGSLRTPCITWFVSKDGIILRIGGIGSGFVPRGAVRRLEPNVGWGCRLEHNWPEIRSPIIMPTEVAKEVARICPPDSVMM